MSRVNPAVFSRIVALIGITLLAVIVGAAPTPAAGTTTGSLRVLVQYPNGEPVLDGKVCVEGYAADSGQALPMFSKTEYTGVPTRVSSAAGADSTYEVAAGTVVAITAWSCGDLQHFTPTHHYGPAGQFEPNTLERRRNGIHVPGGETTTVTIVVGQGILTGDSPGPSFGNCAMLARGAADFGTRGLINPAQTRGRWSGDGTWTLVLPPGEYRITYNCFGGTIHWPAGSTVDTSRTVRVEHGETLTGIDFDTQPPNDITNGTVRVPLDGLSARTSFCTDVVYEIDEQKQRVFWSPVAEGELGEAIEISVAARSGVPFRLRLWDCQGWGFEEVWYPSASTRGGAETLLTNVFEPTVFSDVVSFFGETGLRCGGRAVTTIGGPHDSTIVGTAGDDVIWAFAGDDTILAGEGDDVVCSGDGDDVVLGGPGRDVLYGEDGRDELRGEADGDRLHGGVGRDVLLGGDNLDRIWGGKGSDLLDGGRGNDRLIGGGGTDTLLGNRGRRDVLVGGGNVDRCVDSQPTTRRVTCEASN